MANAIGHTTFDSYDARRQSFVRRIVIAIAICAALLMFAASASGLDVDGFTEPYRSVDVAAAEIGIIAEMKVREGDVVSKGQVLATLDNELQKALLAIAQKNVDARGRLESARAELALRAHHLEKLETLLQKGHARHDEVERARADVAIAQANVLSAEEEHTVRQLEHQKIAVQLQRRNVLAPIDGVVTDIHKDEGEYVAPTDPYVLHMVQLERLWATFSIPGSHAAALNVGDRVPVRVASSATAVEGVLEYVAPITDAESGTVRVKVRLDNPDGAYRSGQRCSLQLPNSVSGQTAGAPRTPLRRNTSAKTTGNVPWK